MVGYVENTDEWHIRARGANNRLRQARLVFSEDAMSEVYIELFEMPDLNDAKTGFLKAKYLPAREKVYQAPSGSVVEQILDKIPELAKTDPDVYACTTLQYGCGLSWGEVMHARYSWLGEADSNIVGDSDSGYVIKVQPDGDWIRKHNSASVLRLCRKTSSKHWPTFSTSRALTARPSRAGHQGQRRRTDQADLE